MYKYKFKIDLLELFTRFEDACLNYEPVVDIYGAFDYCLRKEVNLENVGTIFLPIIQEALPGNTNINKRKSHLEIIGNDGNVMEFELYSSGDYKLRWFMGDTLQFIDNFYYLLYDVELPEDVSKDCEKWFEIFRERMENTAESRKDLERTFEELVDNKINKNRLSEDKICYTCRAKKGLLAPRLYEIVIDNHKILLCSACNMILNTLKEMSNG